MTFLYACTLEKAAAERLTEAFADWERYGPPIAAIDERPNGVFQAHIYFEFEPDESDLTTFLSSQGFDGLHLDREKLQERDWIAESLAGLHPISAGHFYIHGSHDAPLFPGHRLSVEIDAGQAFGTGHHATTAGCLTAIDLVTRARRYHRPIDIGSGTGVLAIATAKTLGCPVIASDNDPLATEITAANAKINQVGNLIITRHASGLQDQIIQHSGPYDLIIANILARPLMAMAMEIARAAEPDAALILSGIMRHQAPAVIARYRTAGFALCRQLPTNEWSTLILRRL
jgi:ribosomal protein L11 methyltransferase